jgi:hypothetical protein
MKKLTVNGHGFAHRERDDVVSFITRDERDED